MACALKPVEKARYKCRYYYYYYGSVTPVYVPEPHHEEPKVYRAKAGERGTILVLRLEIPGQIDQKL